MQLVTTVENLRNVLQVNRSPEILIGLAPTMGDFHQGHLNLIRQAKSECDIVVVSLFVNPAQFVAGEDFDKYPRDLTSDAELAESNGADILFAPDSKEIYPDGFLSFVEVAEIMEPLCGRHRPGHFRAVATVVAKLFNIVQPAKAYFGEKDWQQYKIVERLAADLNFPVEIIPAPTARDADGLALSSRNKYLSFDERQRALVIPKALRLAAAEIKKGERRAYKIKDLMEDVIAHAGGVEIEYVSICRSDILTDLTELSGSVLIAVAVKVGDTRLIDNIVVEV